MPNECRVVDLRSDTVTRPTPEMRRAMAEAEVGDDVYREDPTVNRLEERAAQALGKEAALFVPTGTMGNQIAIKLESAPGDEVICEEYSHVANYEMGMMAAWSGCQPRLIPSEHGQLSWDQIQERMRPDIYYYSRHALVVLENTHNMGGGTVYPIEAAQEICDRAHERGMRVHLDGARIFNAATYLGRPAAELAAPFDSVMFCLSKGLGAPVGSLVAGSREFIGRALRVRKMMGGGMRQAGVLAAAGLIALEKHPAKLAEDHRNARYLAEALSRLPGIQVDLGRVQTNIVMFDASGTGLSAEEFSRRLKARGVLINPVNETRLRLVTHSDAGRACCERAMAVIAEAAEAALRAE
ncbi:MAG: aminotransferase class I/II-fold pyridoxal phosphate-dependent enzyme [Acidobacteria bacterium]|nr:aminotransferase class I/II-fold pyridoxal phosphate-dependent enzyme [Acidobacteriota bacterium]